MANTKKKRRKKKLRWYNVLIRIILILCVLFLIMFAAVNLYLKKTAGATLFECQREAKQLVAESTAEDFRLSETSYIYSDSGKELASLSEDTDATYLTYDEIPQDVINAFVAVEDRSFWTNGGIDYKGIVRVCLNYVRTKGEVAEGASTITQQLARGKFLSNEKSLTRKIKEIFIARELNRKYSKEQIMEFYCNTCCFANGIYGVEDAAKTYLGRPVQDLSLSEIAYICAIPNRPEYYNPYRDSSNAITRRDKILKDMKECNYITETVYREALAEEIQIAEKEEDEDFYNYEVTYAINCAVNYFMKQDGFEFQYEFDSDDAYKEYCVLYNEAYKQAKHKLYTGGYKITTTINLLAQEKLQQILDEHLEFDTEKNEETGIYELQGAMTVIDNETGKVVGIIGGREQEEINQTYSLNRAYQAYRQPGSSFKPLAVYAPALNDGYDASSRLTEVNVDVAKNSTSEKISQMKGGNYSLRYAVEQSLNGCAYSLFNTIGPRFGLGYVTDMQFSRIVPSDYTLSASLGGLTYGVTTVEMANAYSTLENHGEFTKTDCIASILDSDGVEIYDEPQSKQVYEKEAADSMTDILMGVLKRGTARSLNWSGASGVDAAGKTGTTNDKKDGWFCGYTPYYTIAVWVGRDTPQSMSNLGGYTYPAQIWKDAMLYMLEGLPDTEFDIEKSYANSSYQPSKEDTEEEDKEEEDDKKNKEDSKPDDGEKPDDAENTDKPGDSVTPGTVEKPDDIETPEIPIGDDSADEPEENENPGETKPDDGSGGAQDNPGEGSQESPNDGNVEE